MKMDLESTSYWLTRRIFLSALGMVYLFAFLSLAVQIKGLVGEQGILPAAEFFNEVKNNMGSEAYLAAPTLFWLSAQNWALQGACWAGVFLSLLLIVGYLPGLGLFVLWLLYLSLFYAGQIFLGYQWDILLLETGFLAMFLAPFSWSPSVTVVWLLRWLLFRLMVSSALVKWFSSDPAWRDLTALEYHYETQPLPTWIAFYLHQLPASFQKFSTAVMYFFEAIVPFGVFGPRRVRWVAGLILIAFQILILLSGNYGFFNYLTIALCIPLFDDDFWPAGRWRRIFRMPESGVAGRKGGWPKWIMAPLAGLILFLSTGNLIQRWFPEKRPLWTGHVLAFFAPFHLVGNYGLFSVMTKTRREILIEGSMDGQAWLPYEFKYKPGDPRRRPGFVAPHQPRLDWQMWFTALGSFRRQYWFHGFLFRLFENSPAVVDLLKHAPFPNGPKFLRARISDYSFTNFEQLRQSGDWWQLGEIQDFSPLLSRPAR